MSPEIVQFALLLAGWIVSFLLGKELHSGYQQWRTRTVESPTDRRHQ